MSEIGSASQSTQYIGRVPPVRSYANRLGNIAASPRVFLTIEKIAD